MCNNWSGMALTAFGVIGQQGSPSPGNSMANFWSIQQQQMVVPSLDVSSLEINNVPYNGGGGGGPATTPNLSQVLTVGADGGGTDPRLSSGV